MKEEVPFRHTEASEAAMTETHENINFSILAAYQFAENAIDVFNRCILLYTYT